MRRLGFLASIFLPFAALACSGDSDSGAPTRTLPALTPVATFTPLPIAPTAAPTGEPSASPSPTPAEPEGLPDEVEVERVYPELSFEQMTGMYQAPDGRIFVTERRGRLLVFEDDQDVEDVEVALDLADAVVTDFSEQGLLGFAFAPDFAGSGHFYVDYTADDPQRTVVSRFEMDDDGEVDPDSEVVVLEVSQPYRNHNGGQIAFGPDGYLYIALGDGGSARDPQGNGQDLTTLLGSILRIDVAGVSASRAYDVPLDNPFVGTYARSEIWAYGLRNPWRFSFDSLTGDLWAGDVGQDAWEEIDLIEPGRNYGWAVMEGSHCLSGRSCDQSGLTLPVIDYPRSDGCSVSGGFVYRGEAIEELYGAYVYGDYCAGAIWALRYDGDEVTAEAQIADPGFSISSFAIDNAGELYVLEYDNEGGIYRIEP